MNINGLINSFGTSRWIPGLPSYKNGQYEGYAYIGLGLFFLIIISAILYIHELIINRSRTFSKIIDNTPLIILCLGFMLISLSNIVTLGDKVVLSFKLGDGVLKSCFEVFRSSGRFFWPVYYLIFFLVAWIITKRLRIRYALPLIAIGLFLQIWEQKMIQYDLYKDRTYIGNLTDNRWIDVIKPFNTIIVIPPYEYSLKNRDDFIDFSFLASDNYKRITTGYTSRFSADDLKICTDKIIKQIHKRKFKYNQLYVFSELSIVDYLIDIKNLLRCHRLNEYIACYSKKHNAIITEEIDLDTYQSKFASQKLDQYIKDNIDKIIIVAKDEASLALPTIVKDYLSTIGSKINLLGYRDLYVVIIKTEKYFMKK